ncbi:Uncharacterised protein [Mycobacteroides abscessus]|nr:Uncharacterised protein [Mycobacteroides abscessus]
MLLQIFAACPTPGPPQCTTRLPITARIGSASANTASSAPTMNVSAAAVAPGTPPDTGASAKRCPAPVAASCAARASATSTVEQSMNSVPGLAAGSRS